MSGVTLDEIVDLQIVDSAGDALEINADGSINVAATDLDIRDLSASQDNVAISDGTDTLGVNADGSLNVVATATDLDIRDLVNTQDSVAIGDSTDIIDVQTLDDAFDDAGNGFIVAGVRQDAAGSPVSADGDAHPLVFNNDGELKVAADLTSSVADDDADSGNPVKIGGRAQDQGSALSELSAANDRFDLSGDLYRRLHMNDAHNVGMQTSAATVGTTAVELAGTPLDGRKEVTIQNRGSAAIFIGNSGAVTTASGLTIPRRSSATYRFGESINIFAISGSAGQDVRVLEAG